MTRWCFNVLATICVLAATGLAAASAQTPAQPPIPDPSVWRPLDPENTLYIDTDHGRVVIELFPEVAPLHVERVKTLARQTFYDGLKFHRVIDGFMAQTGDPKGDGTGGSELPNLPAEFDFLRGPDFGFVPVAERTGERLGVYKTLPIITQPDQLMSIRQDGKVRAWATHCPGVVSMARANEPDSANSQFFLVRDAYISLDRKYTAWGRVVWNQDAILKLAVGEPPANPDVMRTVRVAADLPEDERAPLYLMRSDSEPFAQLIAETRAARGADFSVCDVKVPVRVPLVEDPVQEEKRRRSWWRVIPFL